MLRQRLRARSFPVARVLADALVVVFALALAWGGAMLVLLACKVAPGTIDVLSGYRTAYHYLASLQAVDITPSTRVITAIAGAASFVVFGWLAWRAIPRPYLARRDLRLAADVRGTVDVGARAIERAVESAARENAAITTARARYGTGDVALDVAAGRAEALGEALEDVHRRAVDSLARHELPPLSVNLTLVRLDRKHRRELQ
jgi:hypothetical protein